MSTTTCPNGHDSSDPEWCDTCGAKMGGAPSPSPTSPSPTMPAVATSTSTSTPTALASGAGPVTCPHCAELNPADALFCEVCGYDFTTGQSPAPTAAADPIQVQPIDSAVGWIAVIEVDQQWYGLKGTLADQACPKASSSTVPLSNHTALIGRSSASRGLRPEIALDADTGVSRRHAQLVRDGDNLTVVDLSSTNGTYVVTGDAEPDDTTVALVPGVPTELRDGDRVYLGAWTRLTVRSS